MEIRPYDPKRDFEDCVRIYGEIGWGSSSEEERQAVALHQESGRTLVAELNGAVEGFASNQDGTMRYLDADLPTCIVAGVGTGRIARRQGIARRVTAEAIAADVIEKGAAVAILGMFDQGFYDKLGFGTGVHDRLMAFDPKDLRVAPTSRVPVRLGADDWERMHRSRVASLRVHGGLVMTNPASTHAEVLPQKQGFGLGFEDAGSGELSHHVWITPDAAGAGPYAVRWLAYRSAAQFLELLGLLRAMADQVHLVRLVEPHWIQLWDLLERPWRRHALSVGSKHASFTRALAWWQLRICDLSACVSALRLPMSDDLRFNLRLTDPIAEHLCAETASKWRGVAGEYTLRVGAASAVESRELDPGLPTLEASVASFSRLWFGVLPASGLAVTTSAFRAPEALLVRLDGILRLPQPSLGWDI